MRLVLGGQTEGEKLAALAAFEREMRSAQMDLHDVADMLRSPLGTGTAPPPWSDPSDPRDRWSRAETLASEFDDDTWPDVAAWLIAQDDAWYRGHQRYLLDGHQRTFVLQMRDTSEYLRPTLPQATWLLLLFMKLQAQLARPEPPRVLALAHDAPPPPHERRQRPVSPPHPQPKPKRLVGRPDALAWIAGVASARRQASSPTNQSPQPVLFTDAETRVLAWYGAQHNAWLIDRSARGKADIVVGHQPLAADMALASNVSLRTVRRALSKAKAAGYLTIERPSNAPGRATLYLPTLPPDGWRHHKIPVTQPRRRARQTAATKATKNEATAPRAQTPRRTLAPTTRLEVCRAPSRGAPLLSPATSREDETA